LQPSVVLYSRLFSPGPEAITIAVSASHAWTPRKSRVAPSVAASGIAQAVQCRPPSVVLSTVPPVPLAQATVPSTESIPRRLAVVPDSCICHGVCAGSEDWAAAKAEAARSNEIQIAFMARSIVARSASTPAANQYAILFGDAIQAAKLDQASSPSICAAGSLRSALSLRNSP